MIEQIQEIKKTSPKKLIRLILKALSNEPLISENLKGEFSAAEKIRLEAGNRWAEEKKKTKRTKNLSSLSQEETRKNLRPLNNAITDYKEACQECQKAKRKIDVSRKKLISRLNFSCRMKIKIWSFLSQLLKEPILTK